MSRRSSLCQRFRWVVNRHLSANGGRSEKTANWIATECVVCFFPGCSCVRSPADIQPSAEVQEVRSRCSLLRESARGSVWV